LPPHWPQHTKSALLQAIALAHLALTYVRGWCADSRLSRVRLKGENERLTFEVELLREELRIKDARMTRIPPRQRPRYRPWERLAI